MKTRLKTISRRAAVDFLLHSGGKIVSVEFIKRTTGELRSMRCRTGVKSHLKGAESAYSFKDKGLVSVFDMEKVGYRVIPIEGLTKLRVKGAWMAVVDEAAKDADDATPDDAA